MTGYSWQAREKLPPSGYLTCAVRSEVAGLGSRILEMWLPTRRTMNPAGVATLACLLVFGRVRVQCAYRRHGTLVPISVSGCPSV
jgi:hypothetical protein